MSVDAFIGSNCLRELHFVNNCVIGSILAGWNMYRSGLTLRIRLVPNRFASEFFVIWRASILWRIYSYVVFLFHLYILLDSLNNFSNAVNLNKWIFLNRLIKNKIDDNYIGLQTIKCQILLLFGYIHMYLLGWNVLKNLCFCRTSEQIELPKKLRLPN